MASFVITAPDGKKYKVTGDTPEGAMAALQKMQGSEPVVQSASPALAVAPTQAADAATNPYTQADTQYDPVTGVPIAGSFANAPTTVTDQEVGVPEGMFFNSQTGQYSSRDMLANNMQPSDAEAALYGLGQGSSFGFGDEGMGILAGALGLGKGTPAQDAKFAREWSRASLDASRRDNPVAAYGGEVAGAMLTPTMALKGTQGAGLGVRMGAGALTGAAQGGLYGFGSAEEGERLDGAATGAKWGAGVGAIMPAIGAAGSKIYDALKQSAANKAFIKATPSTEALKATADDLFDKGRTTGATASKSQVGALYDDLFSVGRAEEVITPKGRFADESSAIAPIFKTLKDYKGAEMSPTAMDAIRKKFTDAFDKASPNEARILKEMKRRFDDFVAPLVPEFKDATLASSLQKGGQSVDEMAALAEARAGQFSNSGMENSIRTEARALDRKIIKGQERGYTPDEIALIERMAKAPPAVVAQLNKFTPNGLMPLMAAGGAGGLLGGPVGAAVGVGLAGGGAITRGALTAAQKGRLELLNALRRTAAGELPKGAKLDPQIRAIIEALMRKGSIAGVVGGQQ